jgi:uncharacterized OsmC-like protein
MGIKALNTDYDLKGIKIEVQKIMKPDPRRVAGINLLFHIPGKLENMAEKDKEFFKKTAENCPVAKSLHPDIQIETDWGAWK